MNTLGKDILNSLQKNRTRLIMSYETAGLLLSSENDTSEPHEGLIVVELS